MPAVPALLVATVLGAPLLIATLFLASGAADPPPPAASCSLELPASVPVVTAPAPVLAPLAEEGRGAGQEAEDGDRRIVLLERQVATARSLVDAAKTLGLDQQAALIAIVVSWERTALLAPAAVSLVRHGGRGPEPHAARLLLQQVAAVPGWRTSALADVVGVLLDSLGETNRPFSAAYVPAATALTGALWQPGFAAALTCGPGFEAGTGGGPAGRPGGVLPQACSVRPDPTTGRGCLTPRTSLLATQLLAGGWRVSCWDPHLWNPSSDHPQGRACDVTIGQAGRYPGVADKARGDALAGALQAGAANSGIDYLIWSGRIWSSTRVHQGWRPYTGGGVYDATSPTGGHYDHIHVSVS